MNDEQFSKLIDLADDGFNKAKKATSLGKFLYNKGVAQGVIKSLYSLDLTPAQAKIVSSIYHIVKDLDFHYDTLYIDEDEFGLSMWDVIGD